MAKSVWYLEREDKIVCCEGREVYFEDDMFWRIAIKRDDGKKHKVVKTKAMTEWCLKDMGFIPLGEL